MKANKTLQNKATKLGLVFDTEISKLDLEKLIATKTPAEKTESNNVWLDMLKDCTNENSTSEKYTVYKVGTKAIAQARVEAAKSSMDFNVNLSGNGLVQITEIGKEANMLVDEQDDNKVLLFRDFKAVCLQDSQSFDFIKAEPKKRDIKKVSNVLKGTELSLSTWDKDTIGISPNDILSYTCNSQGFVSFTKHHAIIDGKIED